jgi:hypothetical protein
MSRVAFLIIAFIGIYTLLRNNVFVLPGQHVWSTNPDIFYKVFLPSLMLLTSIVNLFKTENNNIFLLSFSATLIDLIHRIAIGINHLYSFTYYEPTPNMEIPEGFVRVTYNYWPSHIMALVELAIVFYLFKRVKKLLITREYS